MDAFKTILSSPGVQVALVSSPDIWANHDKFMAWVWEAMREAWHRGRVLYLRNSILEAEMVLASLPGGIWAAPPGKLPTHNWRIGAMTYTQVKTIIQQSDSMDAVLSPKTVILMDDPISSTMDVHIAAGMLADWAHEHSIRDPQVLIKIFGLVTPGNLRTPANDAGHFLQPLLRWFKPLQTIHERNDDSANVGQLQVAVNAEHASEILAKAVACVNSYTHIASFLPVREADEFLGAIEQSKDRLDGGMLISYPLTTQSSLSSKIPKMEDLDVATLLTATKPIGLNSASWDNVSFVFEFPPDAAFSKVPIAGLGMVIISPLRPMRTTRWSPELGMAVVPSLVSPWRLSAPERMRQVEMFPSSTNIPLVVDLGSGGGAEDESGVRHSILHTDVLEYALELVRNWPGRATEDRPYSPDDVELSSAIHRSLLHLEMMGAVALDESGHLVLSKDRGEELLRSEVAARELGLSFNQRCLLSGLGHIIKSEHVKRVLIRLALMDQAALGETGFIDFSEGPTDRYGCVPLSFVKEIRVFMKGPSRYEYLNGKLWLMLGLWDGVREVTRNFTINTPSPQQPDEILGNNNFARVSVKACAALYKKVLMLERHVGIPPLHPGDESWNQPLTEEARLEVQRELIRASANRLAVWEEVPGPICFFNHPIKQATLLYEAMFAQEGYETLVHSLPNLQQQEMKYLLVCGPVHYNDQTGAVQIEYATIVPFALLQILK